MASMLLYLGISIYSAVSFANGLNLAHVQPDEIRAAVREATERCDNETVAAFQIRPEWSSYRFSDALQGKMAGFNGVSDAVCDLNAESESVYPGSLACAVHRELKKYPKESIQERLFRVVQKKIGSNRQRDSIRMHIRVGDVIDGSQDSVESMLTSQNRFLSFAHSKTARNRYVSTLADAWDNLQQFALGNVTLIAGGRCPEEHHECSLVKSCQYTYALAQFLQKRGYSVNVRVGHDPDSDFLFLASSAWFIPAGGGFSNLAANMVRRNDGKVYESQTFYHWFRWLEAQRLSREEKHLFTLS